MTYIVIGSTAARYWLDSWRDPKDLDAFCEDPDVQADAFWHDDFHKIWDDSDWGRFANLDELYTIKVSHLYWDLRNGTWEKHAHDVVELKKAGAQLDLEMHKVLYGVWEERYGKKQVDLNMDKSSFFDDAVPRKYDHDSIHDSVAYGDRPLYESFLKGDEEIMIDMKKVWAAPYEDQIRLFREEIYATALERKIIPSDYKASPRAAYAWALKRTITSLTKGKSARFIVTNLDAFQTPDVNYVQRHKDQSHNLIPFERKDFDD
jgi:hypothetical protein